MVVFLVRLTFVVFVELDLVDSFSYFLISQRWFLRYRFFLRMSKCSCSFLTATIGEIHLTVLESIVFDLIVLSRHAK